MASKSNHHCSSLPVIVSLEVHATPEQQEIMVDIIQSVWKGMLVNLPASDALPSPGELRNKILVKVKHVAPKSEKKPTPVQRARSSSSSDTDDRALPQKDEKKKNSIIPALSDLGVYTRSYHFKNLTAPEATIPCHVFSLSEKKLMEVHEGNGPTLFSHNKNFLMRAFPSGMRVSSSNLDPAVFWRKGVQMVALNWQKWDEGTMLNEGMFSGSEGWVLKPRGYRGRNQVATGGLSKESQADAIEHKTLTLSIEIYAGQNIPLPLEAEKPEKMRLYVSATLHVERSEERSGAPIEGGGKVKEGEYKRKTKTSYGAAPDFGGEEIDFVGIPEVVDTLSFVR